MADFDSSDQKRSYEKTLDFAKYCFDNHESAIKIIEEKSKGNIVFSSALISVAILIRKPVKPHVFSISNLDTWAVIAIVSCIFFILLIYIQYIVIIHPKPSVVLDFSESPTHPVNSQLPKSIGGKWIEDRTSESESYITVLLTITRMHILATELSQKVLEEKSKTLTSQSWLVFVAIVLSVVYFFLSLLQGGPP